MKRGNGNPYPVKAVKLARTMALEGARIFQIQAAFKQAGIDPPPARDTIKRWIDEDYEQARIERQRKRAGFPGPSQRKTWRRRLDRLHLLRGLGLSHSSIAKVMSHDFELSLTTGQVRCIVNGKTSERTLKRVLS